MENRINCLLDGARGIYLPQNFAESFDQIAWNVKPEDTAVLMAGPDHADYWETWDQVSSSAFYIDDKNIKWLLHCGESGDLFAVVEGFDFEMEIE